MAVAPRPLQVAMDFPRPVHDPFRALGLGLHALYVTLMWFADLPLFEHRLEVLLPRFLGIQAQDVILDLLGLY